MKLYGYFRSSAAYRVRLALAFKGVEYESVPVNLLERAHAGPAYRARNPQGLVPALETSRGVVGQSLAIIEYLEEEYPEPPLLPREPWRRAQARSLACLIACDTHPLNNLRVLNYLESELAVDAAGRQRWMSHWMTAAFAALESQVVADPYCLGSRVTLPDLCLVPQLFNARRFEVDLGPFPRLVAIDAALAELSEFAAAHPSRQSDAPR